MRRRSSGVSALIGVDKPVGCTSHDVVDTVRRALGESRVGHAGTLDPLASGVMVVGVGPATRLMQFATAQTKAYRARIALGSATSTDDAQGEVVATAPVPPEALDPVWAAAQMPVLLAMRQQVPPAFSAVHVDGARAYERARAGERVELASRPIEVKRAELVGVGGTSGAPWWDVDLLVSKGTYVRSLARDLGLALGTRAHVAALRRTASGPVDVAACCPPDAFGAGWDGVTGVLDPVAVLGAPVVTIGEADLAAVRDGKRLCANTVERGAALCLPDDVMVALVYDNKLYALARKSGTSLLPSPVFPQGVAGVARRP